MASRALAFILGTNPAIVRCSLFTARSTVDLIELRQKTPPIQRSEKEDKDALLSRVGVRIEGSQGCADTRECSG